MLDVGQNQKGGEQLPKARFAGAFEGLKSQLTWKDLSFGVAASMLIAGLLLGFRFQALPEYKIGDIANQQVIAPQDVLYEEKQATAERREAARDRTPALYELEVNRIADLEKRIELAFSAARQMLSAQRIPPGAG